MGLILINPSLTMVKVTYPYSRSLQIPGPLISIFAIIHPVSTDTSVFSIIEILSSSFIINNSKEQSMGQISCGGGDIVSVCLVLLVMTTVGDALPSFEMSVPQTQTNYFKYD